MAVTTIYKCDKCGAEQPTKDQFWRVGVLATHVDYYRSDWGQTHKSMEVCRPCLESFGIHVIKKPNEPEPPKPPTLDELITDLVQRCVEDSLDAREK